MTRPEMMSSVLVLLGVLAVPTCAQPLGRRLDAASQPGVQFTFSARSGICGDGRSYLRLDDDGFVGNFNDVTRSSPCEAGPVRVVVTRAERMIVRLETFAGPVRLDSSVADLGRVSAAEAAAWLMSLVKEGEGRVARDALLPASIADSARITNDLLDIVRDEGRGRELRRSALSWVARRRAAPDAMNAGALMRVYTELARDDRQPHALRQSAIAGLGRPDRGEGIPVLIQMVASDDAWLARESVDLLGRSGDARARRALRELVANETATGELRAKAMNSLTSEYGSPAEAQAIVRIYPRLTSDRLREGALNAVANVGGSDARAWLFGIIRNRGEAMQQRKRAAGHMDRVGASTAELVTLYDEVEDTELRSALIDQLSKVGTRRATDKLVAIATGDAMMQLRRRAVQALGRVDDPKVQAALKGMVER